MQGSAALVFALIAATATLVALGFVLRPLWRARPRSAAALLAGFSVLAAVLYHLVGTPVALDAAMVERPDTLEEAVAQLERKRDEFPDHEGWVMLATAYGRLGKAAQARDAWREALKRAPDNADVLAAAAEARAQADAQRGFDAEAVGYLQRALKADPRHQRARFFLGIALRQQGKPAEAARTWEPLLAEIDAGNAVTLRAEIDAARIDAGLPALPDAPPPAAAGALTVQVALDPDFAARVRLRGDATVFVIARAPDGPPMPVAVEKHTVADLPLRITLDDADGPMPTAKLSALREVEVIARISASGNPMRQDGDLESKPVRVALPANAPIELTLGAQ
ncbi:tetratricopeptide repeat protein [Lysobacter hankyongensis]|uniref:Tetratricopeptide repeat protein n=1 Tax=Lysobacter hankyongensis TaxID=1176535 RepID=A0ABP9AQY8_9GAMM